MGSIRKISKLTIAKIMLSVLCVITLTLGIVGITQNGGSTVLTAYAVENNGASFEGREFATSEGKWTEGVETSANLVVTPTFPSYSTDDDTDVTQWRNNWNNVMVKAGWGANWISGYDDALQVYALKALDGSETFAIRPTTRGTSGSNACLGGAGDAPDKYTGGVSYTIQLTENEMQLANEGKLKTKASAEFYYQKSEKYYQTISVEYYDEHGNQIGDTVKSTWSTYWLLAEETAYKTRAFNAKVVPAETQYIRYWWCNNGTGDDRKAVKNFTANLIDLTNHTEHKLKNNVCVCGYTEYNIYVAEVKVNSDNANNITGDGISGKVSYDANNNILTLNGASITYAKYFIGYYTNIYTTLDLTINLLGENKINSGFAIGYPIFCNKSNLTITGSGTLYATSDGYPVTAKSITANDCEITGGETYSADITTLSAPLTFTTPTGEENGYYTFNSQTAKTIYVKAPHVHEDIDGQFTTMTITGSLSISTDTKIVLGGNSNCSSNIQVEDNGTLTLCLNGKTLDMGANSINVKAGGTLNICDCTGNGKITSSTHAIYSGGEVNFYSGTIEASSTADYTLFYATAGAVSNIYGGTITSYYRAINNLEGCTLNVYGGSITSENNDAIYAVGSAASISTINITGGQITGTTGVRASNPYSVVTISGNPTITGSGSGGAGVDSYGTLTISGGNISGYYGVVNNLGTLTISGGNISGYHGVYNLGTLTISGGEISSASGRGIYMSGSATANITGGNISSDTNYALYIYSSTATAEISGGTISTNSTDASYSAIRTFGALTITKGTIKSATNSYVSGVKAYEGSSVIINPANDADVVFETGGFCVSATYSGAVTVNGGTFTSYKTSPVGVDYDCYDGVTLNDGIFETKSTSSPVISASGVLNVNGGTFKANGGNTLRISAVKESEYYKTKATITGAVSLPNGISFEGSSIGKNYAGEYCLDISGYTGSAISATLKDSLLTDGELLYKGSADKMTLTNSGWGVKAGATSGEVVLHNHDYSTVNYDKDNHWNECECGEKDSVTAHDFTSSSTCSCGVHSHDNGTTAFTELTDLSQLETSGKYYLGDEIPTVSGDISIASDVEITLCLNGKTFDLDNHRITVDGILTICDCHTLEAEQGKITSNINGYNVGTVQNFGGKLYITGGKIENTLDSSQPSALYNSSEEGIVEITGGIIFSSKGKGITNSKGTLTLQNCTVQSESNYAVIASGGGKVFIKEGATIIGGNNSVYNNGGEVTISGGSVTSSTSQVIYNFNGGTITITGGTISANSSNQCAIYNMGTLNVSGGSVTSALGYAIENNGGTDKIAQVVITGGTISGTVGIESQTTYTSVSISGDSVITGSSTGAIVRGDNDEILGGTITGETNKGVQNSGTLTISGGTITGNTIGVSNFKTLTITGGTIIGVIYGINNEWDTETVTITGGTIKATDGNGISGGATVDISGGEIIGSNYGICVDSVDTKVYLSSNPTITGGTANLRYTSHGVVYAHSLDGNAIYSGEALTISYSLPSDSVISVCDVTDANKDKFTLTNSGYILLLGGTDNPQDDLILHKHAYTAEYTFDSEKHQGICSCGEKTTETNHVFYVSGFCACGVHRHTGGVVFLPWTETTSFPTEDGNYYLKDNVTLSTQYVVSGNVKLCLNGKNVSLEAHAGVSGTLSLYDCNQTVGTIKGHYFISVLEDGTLNLYNGKINCGSIYSKNLSISGTFNMYGGSIEQYCVYLSESTSQFTMDGGTINVTKNNSSCIDVSKGTVIINGGTLEGNGTTTGVYLKFGAKLTLNAKDCFVNKLYDISFYGNGNVVEFGSAFETTTKLKTYVYTYNAYVTSPLGTIKDGELYKDKIEFLLKDGETQTYVFRTSANDTLVYITFVGTFDANGGAWTDESTKKTNDYANGDIISKPNENPTRNGYSFKGWAWSKTGEIIADTAWDNNQVSILSTQKTLYAIWELNAPTFTSYNGYSGTFDNASHTVGQIATHALSETNTITYTVYKWNGSAWIEQTSINTAVFSVKNASDSGKYKLTASITVAGETKSADLEFTVEIAKAKVAKPVADTTVFTYNGNAQTYTVATNALYTVSGNVQTNADSYEVTVSLVDSANYEWADGTTDNLVFDFVIGKAQVTKPVADTTVFTYSGNAQTYTVATNVLYTVSGNVQTNADSYEVTVALVDSANYEWADGTTTNLVFNFVIGKATVSVPSVSSKVYTGANLKADVAENSLYTVKTNAGGINVGEYDVILELTDSNNYKWATTDSASLTLKFNITKGANAFATTPAISGWTFGQTASTPSGSATFGMVVYTYYDSNKVALSGKPTNAGSYFMKASVVADGDNYDAIATDFIAFTISKAKVEKPVADTTVFTYNGSAQTYTVATNALYTVSGNVQTNADSYEVTVALVDSANYEWADGTTTDIVFDFVINKAQVTKPTADSTVFTYNGSAQTYTIATNALYTVSGNVQTNADSYEVIVALVDSNNYEWADGTTTNLVFDFVINKATVSVPSVSSKVYTGANLKAEVAESSLYTVYANAGGINVGEYDVILELTDSNNYKWATTDNASLTVKFNITKGANAFATTPAISGWTFGQTASEPTGSATFGMVVYTYYDSNKVALSGKPTNAGSYFMKASVVANGDNYDAIATDFITFTISAKQVAVVWETVDNFTYNGLDQKASVKAYYLDVDSQKVYLTTTPSAEFKNFLAGGYTFTASLANGETNYVLSSNLTKVYNIKKANLSVTANNNTIVYGDAPSANGVVYSGLVNGESASVLGGTLAYEFSYNQYDNVGSTYTITPKGLTSNNYAISFVNGTLIVEQKEIGINWQAPSNLVYSGEAKTPTATATGLVNGDSVNITIQLASGNNVNYGSFTFEAISLDNDNYKLPSLVTSAIYNIEKLNIEDLEITLNGSLIYNGALQTQEIEALIKNGLAVTYDISGNEQTNADVYTLTVVAKGNFVGTLNKEWAISAKQVAVVWETVDNFTYNGLDQKTSVKAYYLDVDSQKVYLTTTPSAEFKNFLAGGYTFTASLANGETNYALSSNLTKVYNIKKLDIASATVTLNTALTYNGLEQTQTVQSVVINGLTVTYDVSGNTATTVSATKYTLTITGNGNFTGAVNKDWNLNKATYDISAITFNNGVFTYSGSANNIYISGSLPTGVSVDYTNNGVINATTTAVTVTASFTGDSVNYNAIPDMTATITVNKANAVISVDTTDIVRTYGDTWSLPIASTNFGTVVCDKVIGDLVNANTYVVTYTVVGNSNYNGDVKTINVTINKQKVTKPTADTTVFTYNGNDLNYTIASSTLYTVSGNVQTNADSYEVIVALVDSVNYEWADGTTDNLVFDFIIGKAQVNKPSADTTVFTYNGSIQTYTVETNALYTVSGNTRGVAGSQNVTVALVDSNNYEWADGTTTDVVFDFVINKAKVAKPVADTTVFTYTGNTQTYTLASSNFYSVSGNMQTNANDYEVIVALIDSANYEWADGTTDNLVFDFVIGKATAIISVDTTDIVKTYGDSWSLPTATTTFGALVWDKDVDDMLNANTYTVTYSVEGTDNFFGATKTLTVIINKATHDLSGIEFNDLTVKYDGLPHEIIISGTLPNGVSVEYAGNGVSEVGVHTIIATFIYDEVNYNLIAPKTATLTINQAIIVDHIEEGSNKPSVEVSSDQGFAPTIEVVISELNVESIVAGDAVKDNEVLVGAFDVTLEKDGVAVQPGGYITIRLLIPSVIDGREFRLVHNHNGEFSNVDYEIDGEYVVFTVDKLSEFLFVTEDESDLTWLIVLLACIIGLELVGTIVLTIRLKKLGGKGGKSTGSVLTAMLSCIFFKGSSADTKVIVTICFLSLFAFSLFTINCALLKLLNNKKKASILAQASDEKTPEIVEKPVEKSVEKPAPKKAEVNKIVSENQDKGVMNLNGNEVLVRFNRSFTAKIIQADEQIKEFYATIKNYLLSFKGVKARMSWKAETFNKGRTKLAKLNIKGKTLNVYLALSTDDYLEAKFKVINVSDKKSYALVPLCYKVRSNRAVNNAQKLIDDVMNKFGVIKGEIADITRASDYPYEDTNALISKGLIKVKTVSGEAIGENDKLVSSPFSVHQSVTVEEAHKEISDEVAFSLVVSESGVRTSGKKFAVNIDVLSANFNAGDIVDIEALKNKGIVPKKEKAVKILARGRLDKSLTVIADSYSADAIKMIVLVGGTAKLV